MTRGILLALLLGASAITPVLAETPEPAPVPEPAPIAPEPSSRTI